jgi:hypothetical protein
MKNENKGKQICSYPILHFPNIIINNKVISLSDQIKYLGLILDKRNTFKNKKTSSEHKTPQHLFVI